MIFYGTNTANEQLCTSGKKTTTRQMTMKLNIKLDRENRNDGLTSRHSLPTLLCFNFLSHRTKILKFYCQSTLAHLSLPPTAQANARAKPKEPILPTLY